MVWKKNVDIQDTSFPAPAPFINIYNSKWSAGLLSLQNLVYYTLPRDLWPCARSWYSGGFSSTLVTTRSNHKGNKSQKEGKAKK